MSGSDPSFAPPVCTGVVYDLQREVLSRCGAHLPPNAQTREILLTPPYPNQAQQYIPPGLPHFAHHFSPKDQLMLYFLHKVLTFQHILPPSPSNVDPMMKDDNNTIQREMLALPTDTFGQNPQNIQEMTQTVDPPILVVANEVLNDPQYNKLLTTLQQLIALYTNAWNVSPPPTDQQVFDAMERCMQQNNLPIEITINKQPQPQHAQQPMLNSLQAILNALTGTVNTYTNVPILATLPNITDLQTNNPNNIDIFELADKDSCRAQMLQNTLHDPQHVLYTWSPPKFAIPIHIPLLMTIAKTFLPSLNNVLTQMLPANPLNEQAKAYRFHVAMFCVYTHLIATCTLLLTWNYPMQLDLLGYHNPPQSDELKKKMFYEKLAHYWIPTRYVIPPHIAQVTQGPNPSISVPQQGGYPTQNGGIIVAPPASGGQPPQCGIEMTSNQAIPPPPAYAASVPPPPAGQHPSAVQYHQQPPPPQQEDVLKPAINYYQPGAPAPMAHTQTYTYTAPTTYQPKPTGGSYGSSKKKSRRHNGCECCGCCECCECCQCCDDCCDCMECCGEWCKCLECSCRICCFICELCDC